MIIFVTPYLEETTINSQVHESTYPHMGSGCLRNAKLQAALTPNKDVAVLPYEPSS